MLGLLQWHFAAKDHRLLSGMSHDVTGKQRSTGDIMSARIQTCFNQLPFRIYTRLQ